MSPEILCPYSDGFLLNGIFYYGIPDDQSENSSEDEPDYEYMNYFQQRDFDNYRTGHGY